jgi:hypothetical protein
VSYQVCSILIFTDACFLSGRTGFSTRDRLCRQRDPTRCLVSYLSVPVPRVFCSVSPTDRSILHETTYSGIIGSFTRHLGYSTETKNSLLTFSNKEFLHVKLHVVLRATVLNVVDEWLTLLFACGRPRLGDRLFC